MSQEIVIAINPGSTSTKIAIYNRSGELASESIGHNQQELDKFERISDQMEYRYTYLVQTVNAFKNGKD